MQVRTVDDLWAVVDRPPRAVLVPEWGATVYVRAMSSKMYQDHEDMAPAEIVAGCLCDENGHSVRMTPQDTARLADMHAAAIDRLCLEVLKLTGLREDDGPQPDVRQPFTEKDWSSVQSSLRGVATCHK
jgi:hypothetical protein